MAASQLKTPLSVLRKILGKDYGGEDAIAQKIGKSTSWVRKASCGQIPIYRETARAISEYTGIDVDWIMDGNAASPAVDINGDKYFFETFKRIPKRKENNMADAIVMLAEAINKLTNAITENPKK
jgi:transcriptional regulator with XRE-family HTH domain